MLELGNDPREGLASGKDAPVIYIEGEIWVTRAFETKLEEGGSKNSREDRGKQRALRGTAERSKRL